MKTKSATTFKIWQFWLLLVQYLTSKYYLPFRVQRLAQVVISWRWSWPTC